MKLQIAENIRAFRKERSLTQERLAEVLGVTVGAVSKWESGLSIPDITLIVAMADFFETSVDVLLGYGWHAGSMSESVSKIKALRNAKKFDEASAEAEKALERFPNAFDVVFNCAVLFAVKGVEQKCDKSYRRALALFERSLELIGQNRDEKISEWMIRDRIADLYLCIGQVDTALEQMKKNNFDGINNGKIGYNMAKNKNEPDEALKYLSGGLTDTVIKLTRITAGYSCAYDKKHDFANSLAVEEWLLTVIDGLILPGTPSYYVKMKAQIACDCAITAAKLADIPRAKVHLCTAMANAKLFDNSPCYNFSGTRFCHNEQTGTAFDDFGTVIEGIKRSIEEEGKSVSTLLLDLYKEIESE